MNRHLAQLLKSRKKKKKTTLSSDSGPTSVGTVVYVDSSSQHLLNKGGRGVKIVCNAKYYMEVKQTGLLYSFVRLPEQ